MLSVSREQTAIHPPGTCRKVVAEPPKLSAIWRDWPGWNRFNRAACGTAVARFGKNSAAPAMVGRSPHRAAPAALSGEGEERAVDLLFGGAESPRCLGLQTGIDQAPWPAA